MRIISIDPGPEESAYAVIMDGEPEEFGKVPNEQLLTLAYVNAHFATDCVCERIRSYGMPAGASLFETCEWSGRLQQAWLLGNEGAGWHWLPRNDVKLNLCGSPRAKDANVRQAVIDRFGGKDKAIGTKRNPGPLYGCSKDCWAAVAVGLTWLDLQKVAA